MGFNLRVMLHLGGILLTMSLLAWCLLNTSYYATMLTLTIAIILQITSLLYLINSTNRELVRFFDAVKHGDFSQSFKSRNTTRSFSDLGTAFDAVIARFRLERSSKEEQAGYLQALVQQLPIAVFSLHDDGRISLANLACRKLFGIPELTQLRQLYGFDETLGATLTELQPGHELSLKVVREQTTLDLRLSCTILRSKGQQHKLVSILDIRSELEARELQAWQNLIRVMTHEIMNSITPITSLAETTGHYVQEALETLAQNESAMTTMGSDDVKGLLSDASNAVTTIGKRSLGLQHFVDSYRSLSRLPTPRPELFSVHALLQGICKLMAEQMKTGGIILECTCVPTTLELRADPELLEQALINLVKNAAEAVTEVAHPVITLAATLKDRGQVQIAVRDNGCGISPENLDNIFIPFFTTKRGGSGIGMSIVRQIVKSNGGSINVISAPGAGTTVNLDF